jgi:hypothetical protein
VLPYPGEDFERHIDMLDGDLVFRDFRERYDEDLQPIGDPHDREAEGVG